MQPKPPRIGLALGSGSARGWAHIGVINALERAGIAPHIVCGTSIGALVGAGDKASAYADELQRRLQAIERDAASLPRRPKVYFEEWDEPPITGIRWVAELIRIAGGDDIFPERALEPLAKARILEDAGEVIRRAPDIILGSWCGKKFRPEKVAARAGWDAIPAVRDGQLFEVKSPIILQPGPAALTDGVAEIARIIREWSKEEGAE